jgi:hypothetical protein
MVNLIFCDVENFYNTLNAILNQQKEKDLTILMGYFNAKVGYNNTGYEQTMGRHGIGQMIKVFFVTFFAIVSRCILLYQVCFNS